VTGIVNAPSLHLGQRENSRILATTTKSSKYPPKKITKSRRERDRVFLGYSKGSEAESEAERQKLFPPFPLSPCVNV
jgi:hypothetical protein